MSTDNKTIMEQAIEWWGGVREQQAVIYRMQYFKKPDFLTDEQIEFIYLSEHPQQTVKEDSVLSLEDAAYNAIKDKYSHLFIDDRIINPDNLPSLPNCEVERFKQGANWQKEQYSELLSSYRELFEAIKLIEMKSWQKDEWEQMKIINNIAKSPLERATNILNNLK